MESGLWDKCGQNGKEMDMKRQKLQETLQRNILVPMEVCEQLRISRRTLRRLVSAGKIKGVMVGGRLRFRTSQIEVYLMANVTKANEST